MERAEADKLGLKKYETGRPCKHGHVVYRYTESGACSACVKNLVTISGAKSADLRAKIEQVTKRIYLHSDKDGFAAIKTVVDFMIVSRFPDLPVDTVNPDPLEGVHVGGTAYRVSVRVPPEDVAATYEAFKFGAIDGAAECQRIHGKNADVPLAPAPDWSRIPKPGDFDYKGD